ncbi:MAG TPA: hypothetical protein VGN11_07155 [Candidatus Baltobacteraceae bacterium]|jgi:hypothetical protein|nr:hypothetical protein [Candidatus Baltobacteraceae bacterium]
MMRTAPRSLAFDYAVGICSVWISSGFFLDAWAHGHVPVESFFTPYHGVFYSGMLAMIAVLAAFWLRHRALPPGYRLAVLGIPIFIVAGCGDLLWHMLLGIEEGVDALLSPTHQCLGLGIFFLAAGPIRSVLADRARSTTFAKQFPLVLGLVAWLTLVHFGTAYAFDPGAGRTNAPPAADAMTSHYLTAIAIGYYKISIGVLTAIFQAIVMTGFALWMTSRISLRPGCFTLFFVLGNAGAAAAFTNHTPLLMTTLLQSLAAGIVADVLAARTDPQPDRPGWYRVFSVAVPLAYMGTYLLVTLAADRLWWDWNESLGAWMWCGVVGFALSLIGTARRTPA